MSLEGAPLPSTLAPAMVLSQQSAPGAWPRGLPERLKLCQSRQDSGGSCDYVAAYKSVQAAAQRLDDRKGRDFGNLPTDPD